MDGTVRPDMLSDQITEDASARRRRRARRAGGRGHARPRGHRDAGGGEARHPLGRPARHRRQHRDDGAAALLGPRAAGARRRARRRVARARHADARRRRDRPADRGRLPVGRPERRRQPDRARLRAAGRARAHPRGAPRHARPRCGWSAASRSRRSRAAPTASPSAPPAAARSARATSSPPTASAARVRAALGIPASDSGPLAERLTVLLRGPLWELVGEHRHVIYFLDGEVAAVPIEPPRPLGLRVPGARAGRPRRRRSGEAVGGGRRRSTSSTSRRTTYAVELAERFRERSAFLIGDAAHRLTPRGATGHEHRDPRRLRPRLEARVGAARLGRRGAARQLRGRAPPGGRAQRRPRRPTRTAPSAASRRSCTSTSAAASRTRGCRARPGGCRRSTCSATG